MNLLCYADKVKHIIHDADYCPLLYDNLQQLEKCAFSVFV